MEDNEDSPLTHAEAKQRIDEWLPYTEGKTFEARDVWAQFNVWTAEGKHNVAQVLSYYKHTGKLDGDKGKFRFVNKALENLDWVAADTGNILDIKWPIGWGDRTTFGFDDNLTLYPGSIVIVAGVSNMGKTTFMHNILVRNMDTWKCRYLTNEMGSEEFRDRMDNFEDAFELTDEFGDPKFETGTRYSDYQDVVLANGLTIIDYLDPGESPYLVGQQIDAIKQKIGGGVAFIAIQKKLTTLRLRDGRTREIVSDYGTGGQYSEHRARIVLHIEKDYLYVKKAKKCRIENVNGKKFAYAIKNNGSQFYGIRPYVEEENG